MIEGGQGIVVTARWRSRPGVDSVPNCDPETSRR